MSRTGDYVLVCHLKGTLSENDQDEEGFQPEIIEVTLILLDQASGEIQEKEFHCYVALKNKELNERTIQKTGVKQFMIDQADSWRKVIPKMEDWLNRRGDLLKEKNFILVGIGPEFEELLHAQKKVTKEATPKWLSEYVNFEKEFKNAQKMSGNDVTLEKMLEHAGVSAETDPEKPRGRDEAYDLALLVSKLLKDRHEFSNFDKIQDR